MISEHSSKNRNVMLLISAIILLIGIFLCAYSSVIFQEGNPWKEIKGIYQLNFTSKDIVKLSPSEEMYITKSKNGKEIITQFMKDRGYEYADQMGSGYFFKSPSGVSAIAVHRYYSRFYSLWNITQDIKAISLKDKLMECMPKSDSASHERCIELLKQITDYKSCVAAGFSIMKSNPPQCTPLDGRTFVEGV